MLSSMIKSPKILVIDDDEKLNALLKEYLSKFGFEVFSAIHPADGLKLLEKISPDLVVLDVMMPDMDGFEVCREIRKNNNIPIIMLTARGELTDKVVGLELGADDYLAKPFEPRELVARIQVILRRINAPSPSEKLKVGRLELFPDKYLAKIEDKQLEISTLEYILLELLVKNKGKVLSRDQIMDNLHGIDWQVFDRSIDVLISRLRQKLNEDLKNPEYIKTIRGVGYQFIGD
jgi:DNA-binding response OmpR family regulator